jgi:hypothetical protein
MTANRLEGLKKVVEKLENMARLSPEMAGQALYAWSQGVILLARQRAPYEEGHLERSGYAAEPDMSSAVPSVTVGFGGKAEEYAAIQHDDTSLNHPGQRAIALGVTKVGQALFLNSAIDDQLPKLTDTLSRYIRTFAETGRISKARKRVPTSPWEEG